MITWDTILAFLTSVGLRILYAGLLLVAGLLLIKFLIKIITNSKGYKKIDVSVQSFIASFLAIGLKAILIVSVISVLGLPITSVIAVLASAGLAIGLALQGSLSNFAGGLMILIFKPFRVGDFIDNGNHSGTVESITIFYTKIITVDNRVITIPNKSMTDTAIINFSVKEQRRVEIRVTASYNNDIDKVKEILLSLAEQHPLIIKTPQPFARLSAHKDNSLEYVLRVWTKKEDFWTVHFDLLEGIKKQFDACGISIPYPQLDVHIQDISNKLKSKEE